MKAPGLVVRSMQAALEMVFDMLSGGRTDDDLLLLAEALLPAVQVQHSRNQIWSKLRSSVQRAGVGILDFARSLAVVERCLRGVYGSSKSDPVPDTCEHAYRLFNEGTGSLRSAPVLAAGSLKQTLRLCVRLVAG